MSTNELEAGGERGVIINTASGAAWQGQIGQAAYSASKAGVMGLPLPVARDLADLGIRVVTIAPGLFDTSMVAGLPENVSHSITNRIILFPTRIGQVNESGGLVRQITEKQQLKATHIQSEAPQTEL